MSTKEQNSKLNKAIAVRVRDLREKLNLSRSELAERLGISDYFLVEIESGRKGVSNVTLCKLSDVLCTTTDYLLLGKINYTSTDSVVNMLMTLDAEYVEGAESILKSYINAITLVKVKNQREE